MEDTFSGKLSVSELRQQLENTKIEYINRVLDLLRTDPFAPDHHLTYSSLEDYLHELFDKDGSVLSGLLIAIETYLEK